MTISLLLRLGCGACLLFLAHTCIVFNVGLKQLLSLLSSPASAVARASGDNAGAVSASLDVNDRDRSSFLSTAPTPSSLSWICPKYDWKAPPNCPKSMIGNRSSFSHPHTKAASHIHGRNTSVEATSQKLALQLLPPANTANRSTLISPPPPEAEAATTAPPSLVYLDDPTFAIAMIALGEEMVTSSIFEHSVQSIRRRGLYCGPILILTDIVNNATTAESKAQRFDDMTQNDPNIHPIYVESRPTNMMIKRYKMELLDILDERSEYDAITYLLYIDVDIMVGEPLNSFLGYVHGMTTMLSQPSRASRYQSYMLMFEEQGTGPEMQRVRRNGSSNTVFHGGVIVLNRKLSRGCLNAWQSLFDDTELFPTRDQTALYHMLYESTTLREKCMVVQMDHRPFLLMPTSESMKAGDASVFVHVTSGRRSRRIDHTLQADYYRCVMMVDEEYAEMGKSGKKKKNCT